MPRDTPRREEEEEFDVENGRQEDEHLGKLKLLACCLLVCTAPFDLLLSCVTFLAVPSLAIACITVGFVYFQDCQLEPLIPVWMAVQGFLILFGFVVERSSRCIQEKKPPSTSSSSSSSSLCTSISSSSSPVRIFSIFLLLTFFAWLTAGNLWVFRAASRQSKGAGGGESCDPAVYVSSLMLVIASDVAIVLLPVVMLLPMLSSRVC